MAADRAARHADDTHRPITARDLLDQTGHVFGDDVGETSTGSDSTDDIKEDALPLATANPSPFRDVDTYTTTARNGPALGDVADDRSCDVTCDYLAEPTDPVSARDRATSTLSPEHSDDQLHLAVVAATVALDHTNQRDPDHATHPHEPEHSSLLQPHTIGDVNAAAHRLATHDHAADWTPRHLDGFRAADRTDELDELNGS